MVSGQFTVKLSGMPYRAKPEDIRKFLSDVKIVDSPDALEFTKNSNNLPTGDCYVMVQSKEDIVRALSYNKKFMGTRYVEVREVTSNSQVESAPKDRYTGCYPIAKMRGLPYECTKEEIVKFFSGLSITGNGIVMPVDDVGRASGDAFVEFTSKEDFEKALTYDRKTMGRRYVEVFKSSHHDMNEALDLMAGGKYQLRHRSRERVPDRTKPYERNTFSPYESRNRFIRPNARPCSHHAVHASGLPYKASETEIADFFYPAIPLLVRILLDSAKRPSGEAYVYFRSHRDCIEAMTKDGHQLGNRYIVLTPYTQPDNEFDAPGPHQPEGYYGRGKRPNPRGYDDYDSRMLPSRHDNYYGESRGYYQDGYRYDERAPYDRYPTYTVGDKPSYPVYSHAVSPRDSYSQGDPYRSDFPFRPQSNPSAGNPDRGIFSKESAEYQTPVPSSHWSGIKDPNAAYHSRPNGDMQGASLSTHNYSSTALYTTDPQKCDQQLSSLSYNPFAAASSSAPEPEYPMIDGGGRVE